MKTPRFLLPVLVLLLGPCLASPLWAQNDAFASRTILTGNPLVAPVTSSGSNVGATKETGEPNHGFNAGGASVWFSWTAPAAGAIRISLAGSSFDTTMGIYSGTALGSLNTLNLNDDGDGSNGAGTYSEVLFRPVAGATYLIAVDGWNGGTTAATGNYVLTLSPAPPGPANDDLANAQSLGTVFPVRFFGGTNVNATRESAEPFYLGRFGAASVWYSWTAPANMPVEVNTIGCDYPTYLGVFTGSAYGALTTVGEDATRGANRVSFDAVAGTTYRIVVEGEGDGIQHFGTVGLNIVPGTITALFPFGSSWSWFHPTDGVDPSFADPDFDTTWFHPAVLGYNGPVFNAPAAGLFGYGTIDYGPIATNIGTPVTGLRYSAYFLRNFTLTNPVPNAVADILADDGAAIYVDGVDVARVNFSGADTYLFAADGVGSESTTSRIALGALTAGPHTLAVSLHNQSNTSSDLGFDLRLLAALPTFGEVTPPAATGFEEPPVGATSYLGRRIGTEIGFVGTGEGGTAVRDTTSGKAIEIQLVANATITSETIDTRDFTAVTARIDLRTFDTSTGFEAADNLRAVIEGSLDGITFSTVADLIPLTTGGRELTPPNDRLIVYSTGGGYTAFSTPIGAIPDAVKALRVVITASVDSPNEHIVLDNLSISGTPSLPPASLRITAFTGSPATGFTITIGSEPGKTYRLQTSANLASWADGETKASGGATTSFTVAGPLPVSPPGWFRVVEL